MVPDPAFTLNCFKDVQHVLIVKYVHDTVSDILKILKYGYFGTTFKFLCKVVLKPQTQRTHLKVGNYSDFS